MTIYNQTRIWNNLNLGPYQAAVWYLPWLLPMLYETLRHQGRDWEKLHSRWSDEPKYTTHYLYRIPITSSLFLTLLCSANLYIPSVLSFVVFISLYITSLIIFRFTYILNCGIILSSCICIALISLHLLPICCIFALCYLPAFAAYLWRICIA